MTLQTRPKTGLRSTLLLTGIALSFAQAGCSSSTSKETPDARIIKDTAVAPPDTATIVPDVAPPKDTTVVTPDTMVPLSDLAPPKDTAPPDVVVPPPDAGLPDVLPPLQDTGVPQPDGPLVDVAPDTVTDSPAPTTEAGADQGEGGAETGVSACLTPTSALAYPVPALTNIAWDKDGSLITARQFYNAETVFGGKTLTHGGSADIFVAKLDPRTGNATWVLTVGDDKDQFANGVAVTSAGIGVIGSFKGTLTIGAGITNANATKVDYMAGVDDTAGTGTWSKKVNLQGGALNAIAGHVNKDYFVICGTAMNTAANLSTAGLSLTKTPGGGQDVVVAAIKASDGTVLWSNLFGGAMDQTCTAAALDDDGNVILAGTYAGTLDFGAGALSPAPTGTLDQILWVAKLKGSDGTVMAAKGYGTTGYITPTSLAVDAQGNAMVAGLFQTSSVTFGSQTITLSGAGSSNDSAAFVAKLGTDLSASWARGWGSTATASRGVAIDSQGNPTVVGNFLGTISVGPGASTLTAHRMGGASYDVFVVSLDGATGTTSCAHNYGDSASSGSAGFSIAINRWASGAKKDAKAVVGSFNRIIDFGPPTNPLSFSSTDMNATQAYLLQM
jgi:hypothetical protein